MTAQPQDLTALRASVQAAQTDLVGATRRHVASSYGKQQKREMVLAKSRHTLAEADLAIAELRPRLEPDEARTLAEVVENHRRAIAVAARNIERPTFALADDAVALAEADLDQTLTSIRAAVQARLDEQARQARLKEAPRLAKDADALWAEAESHFQALDRIGGRLAALKPRLALFERPERCLNGMDVFHREMPAGLPALVAFFCRRVHDDAYLACRDRWALLLADRRRP